MIGTFDHGGGPRHRSALTAIAADGTVDLDFRIWVSAALARYGDPTGAKQLDAFAADADLDAAVRVRAAIALTKAGDARGPDRLVALAGDRLLDGDARAVAASALSRTDDPRRVRVLALLLADPRLEDSPSGASRLVNVLGRLDLEETEFIAVLSEIADDDTVDAHTREWAAETLSGFAEPDDG